MLGAEAAAIAILHAVSRICRWVSRASILGSKLWSVVTLFRSMAPTIIGSGPLFCPPLGHHLEAECPDLWIIVHLFFVDIDYLVHSLLHVSLMKKKRGSPPILSVFFGFAAQNLNISFFGVRHRCVYECKIIRHIGDFLFQANRICSPTKIKPLPLIISR